MLARWYMLLGQFLVTFEYRPGAQHANADGIYRQCGQCQRPDCPVSSSDSRVSEVPFRLVGDGRFHGRGFVAGALWGNLVAATADLPPAGSDMDVIEAPRQYATLTTIWDCVQSGEVPAWSDCSGLSPELCWCWRLQIGNLSVDTEGR